ncbi:regulatory protein RecX [Perlucidibaca aquatica]|uniref:regulatory protein RecX n=1 Tax=Perlucidibaca aquatica TaxID=1852776 RepID=UPI00083B977C|nr:regulatory protein RecX [Perlucidibaca aquatica]
MSRAFSKKPASKRVGFGASDNDEPIVITAQQVWNKALSLQGRREHSRTELIQKLSQFGASQEQIEDALSRLVEYSLQSDDRFAESLVRTQLLRGRGQRSIKQVLQQRGLDAEHPALIEQTADIDWEQRALDLLLRRFGTELSQDMKDKARYIRFLQYRGFSMGQALTAMKLALSANQRIDNDADEGQLVDLNEDC